MAHRDGRAPPRAPPRVGENDDERGRRRVLQSRYDLELERDRLAPTLKEIQALITA